MNKTHYLITGLTVVAVVASWYGYQANQATATLQSEVEQYASTQWEAVLAAADALRQTNAVEPAFAGVVSDCVPDDRAELDGLLSRLSELSRSELTKLRALYDECGAYFAEQRSLKVFQLQTEAQQLQSYYDAHSGVVNDDVTYRRTQLATLVELETTNARLSRQLVAIQSDIIDALLAGVSQDSETVLLLLASAQEARENLQFTTQEARSVRTVLSP
jgi:Tfp pilus assembly protein PilV